MTEREGIIRFNAPFHCFRTNKPTRCCEILLISDSSDCLNPVRIMQSIFIIVVGKVKLNFHFDDGFNDLLLTGAICLVFLSR